MAKRVCPFSKNGHHIKMEKENKCIFEKITQREFNEFVKKLTDKGIELDKIDLNALSPKDTTLEVMDQFIYDQYGITLKQSYKELRNSQDKFNWLINQELKKEEENSEEELNKSINQIKTETTEELKNAYLISNSLIETLIGSEYINGYILRGNTGIGKSFSVSQQLISMDLEKGKDFEILSSYTTPMSFYEFLYENKDKQVIILDDVARFFDNPINQGIVLSALWGEGKKNSRVVKYNSNTSRLNAPKSFTFHAKLIWCVNEIPKRFGIEPIKSRCYYYELNFTYAQKIKLMYELCKVKNISIEIMDFIKENTDESVINLDFRLLLKLFDLWRNNPKNWEDIAIKLISRDETRYLLKKYLKENSTIKEAQEKWSEETGLTRRTFYRLKRESDIRGFSKK